MNIIQLQLRVISAHNLPARPGPGHVLYHYIVREGPHAIALFDYEASQPDELSFKVLLVFFFYEV